MGKTLKVLVVEDSEDDTELLLRELRRGGFDPMHERVDTADGVRAALANESWEIIVCDHRMPKFSSFAALELIREHRLDIPFIVVSGSIGEDIAVEAMRAGTHDYLMKDNLARLVPAVERELREAESRRQRRRADEQLRQAVKMEAVGQLTGGVAHDFNYLLTVILGNLELLDERLPDDGSLRELARAAMSGARRGAELTARLLAFSRKQPLQPGAIDLGKLILGMDGLLDRTLGEAIAIETASAAGLWRAAADFAQVENALLNLALNARDAMPWGGTLTIVAANARIGDTVAAAAGVNPGDYVTLAVGDTGSGMTAHVIEHAFEPFFTTKETGKGSGLGLSMIYGFAKQSGGHVTIESTLGEGTSVTLYLPRARAERVDPAATAHADVDRGHGETVLVVEDDVEVHAVAVALLTELGYRVLEAGDGPSAIHAVDADSQIDLLFTDVVLPSGVSGFELAAEVRERRPHIGLLFASGYSDEAVGRHGMLHGHVLMPKPYRRADLARAVHRALEARAAPGGQDK